MSNIRTVCSCCAQTVTQYLMMGLGCQLPPRVAWVLPPDCSENHTWAIYSW